MSARAQYTGKNKLVWSVREGVEMRLGDRHHPKGQHPALLRRMPSVEGFKQSESLIVVQIGDAYEREWDTLSN